MLSGQMGTAVLGGRGRAVHALVEALEASATPFHQLEPERPLPPDVDRVVIDATDPSIDAQALSRTLRAQSPDGRILVIVGDDREPEVEIEGLIDAGATDWLLWPRDALLLKPRLKTFLLGGRTALADGPERLRLLFAHAVDAISITDLTTGRFVDVNDAWSRQYGYPRDEAVGRMGPRDVSAEVQATAAAVSRLAQNGHMCRQVKWHRAKDGRVFPVEIHAGSYRTGGRHIMVATLRDLSVRLQLEGQLRQSDRLVSVGTVAASVAHEINNPLAFVSNNLDFLHDAMERHLSGEPLDLIAVRSALSEARAGTRRVREIVRDLKAFFRGDAAEPSAVDVCGVMDVALRFFANDLRQHASVSRTYLKAPQAWANGSRLGQVFVNLLSNAINALPERATEENRLDICIHTGPSGEVVVEVRDNGRGIPPELLGRIFDPFFTTRPQGEGTGLGLAICREIVEGFGGRIEVESAPGKGSMFRVILPAAQPVQAAAVGAASEASKATTPKLKLLLIDDERNLGLVLGRALESDLELEFVTDGHDGLRRIQDGQRFDAVVCDLMMPTMSGMEFYEHLQRVNGALAERTGFITGGTFTPPAREFASKMNGRVIEKPFLAEDLHAFVRLLTGRT